MSDLLVKSAAYGEGDEVFFELLVVGEAGLETVSNVYRPNDPYAGVVGAFLANWIAEHASEIGPYVPPPPLTDEQRRAAMPNVSARQLRLTLVRNGFSLSSVDAAISGLPEGTQKDEALIEWEYAHEFQRVSPTLNSIASALSISQEQIDGMWSQALSS
ncbi:hypothetical protein MRBLMR1_004876 [Neorhizobium sp. LMR1-1-1.1]